MAFWNMSPGLATWNRLRNPQFSRQDVTLISLQVQHVTLLWVVSINTACQSLFNDFTT